MSNCRISVVIAAKDPPWEYLNLCLSSFAALRNAPRIQVVLVLSGKCAVLPERSIAVFESFNVLDVPANGVYAAYNTGIDSAKGRYVLFFGVDDVALPGMDVVIDHLSALSDVYQLFAGACFMQNVGLAIPSSCRMGLILRNWCHQGIFYSTEYVSRHRYQAEYRAQADHKMNIDIVSNRRLKFGVTSELVAYFSAGGESSLKPDLHFRKHFPSIVSQAYGWPFGVLVRIKQLVIDGLLGPPEHRFRARRKK